MMDGALAIYQPSTDADMANLMRWAAKITPGIGIEGASGFGILRDGRLIAAIFYSNWHRGWMCDIGVVSTEPGFLSRRIAARAFALPFKEWGVRRLGAVTSRKNKKARRLLEKLGFKFESIAREGWGPGGDAAIYSMLPGECKWLR